MIFDVQALLSNAQAVTVSAASTNVIDLTATGTVYKATVPIVRDVGKGNDVPLRIQVVETFATLTSLTVIVQTSVDAAFTSPIDVATTVVTPLASLVAGKVFNITEIPEGVTARYLRLYYTVVGTAATAGKITAGVVAGNQTS